MLAENLLQRRKAPQATMRLGALQRRCAQAAKQLDLRQRPVLRHLDHCAPKAGNSRMLANQAGFAQGPRGAAGSLDTPRPGAIVHSAPDRPSAGVRRATRPARRMDLSRCRDGKAVGEGGAMRRRIGDDCLNRHGSNAAYCRGGAD